MRYLIADFVVEIEPKYEHFAELCAPFAYSGERTTDFKVNLTDEHLNAILKKMVEGSTAEMAEEFCSASIFNRKIINRGAMLVHSSVVVCDGKAYLFSADSGVGKTTHTNLWLKAFGDRVHILNGDKPVVRMMGGRLMCCGTPFDGGSGVALNETVPVGAIVFVERDEKNYVTVPKTSEIVSKLYMSTVKNVDERTGVNMLGNFDEVIKNCKFYVLHCNMDISAAYTAYDALIANEQSGDCNEFNDFKEK